jgi:glycosyltransferase involved in cell wall biosynthesis
MSYVIITPAFNEERYIEKTIMSVIKQTVLPIEWIIVNDGSKDNTASIVEKYIKNYGWIKLVNKNHENFKFGEHAVKLFNYGVKNLESDNYNYIVKLDADLEIDRNDYFEFQIKKMIENPKLGICSGITYSINNNKKEITKKRPYWHTGGAMKFYRQKCLSEISGLEPIFGWDGLDEYKAMYFGWKTRTFFNLHVNHLGKKRAVSRKKQNWLAERKGESLYLRGYPTEFVLLKLIMLLLRFKIKKALYFFKGFVIPKFNGKKRIVSKHEARFNRKFQYNRIIDKFLKDQNL